MITLIGFRCTHSNVLSHEVLIRPSRPETQTSQYMFAQFTHLDSFYFTILKIEIYVPWCSGSQSFRSWFKSRGAATFQADDRLHVFKNTDIVSWWFGAVATPVPIPNTEVKRSCGDDSLTGESS